MNINNKSFAFCLGLGLVLSRQMSANVPNIVKQTEPASKAIVQPLASIKGIALPSVSGPPMERFPDLAIGGSESGQRIFKGTSSSGMYSEGQGLDVFQRKTSRRTKASTPTVAVPLGSFAIQDALGLPSGIKAYQVQVPAHARAMGRLNTDHPAWFSLYLVNELGLVKPNMSAAPKTSAKPAAIATNDTDVPIMVYFVLDSRVISASGEPYVLDVVLGRLSPIK